LRNIQKIFLLIVLLLVSTTSNATVHCLDPDYLLPAEPDAGCNVMYNSTEDIRPSYNGYLSPAVAEAI